MKKSIKFFVLALLSTVILPLTVNAEVTDWDTTDALPTVSGSYTLTADVSVNTIWDLSGKEINLNLNGHSITTTQKISVIGEGSLYLDDSAEDGAIISSADPAVYVENGNFEMNGGTIKTSTVFGYGVLLRGSSDLEAEDYSVFNFGENAKIQTIGDGYTYGVAIGGVGNKANGVVINIRGDMDLRLANEELDEAYAVGMYINGSYNNMEGNVPIINIYETASIDTTLPDQTETMESAVIYAAGYGIWNIYGGTFRGQEGFSIKSGVFNIFDADVVVYGDYVDPATTNNNGSEDTGAAVSITSNSGYAHNIEVYISGGKFVSENGNALYEGIATDGEIPAAPNTYVSALEVTGGAFSGKEENGGAIVISNFDTIDSVSISGGYYNTNPSEYKDEEIFVVDNAGTLVSATAFKYALSDTYGKQVSDDDKTLTEKPTTYDPNGKEDLVLVFNGLADNFDDLYIDEKLVPTDMYTVESGSTIITIKAAYLKALSAGTHTVVVNYSDGSVSTTISSLEPNPSTSDGILSFVGLFFISVVGAYYCKKYITAKMN